MTDLYYFDPRASDRVNAELNEFANRSALIIQRVFHRPYNAQQAFRLWFQDLVREYDNPASILHDDPLIIAAQYCGIDANAATTGTMGLEYQKLAQQNRW